MRSYERNGVTVDQCTECRGIFLDRGELERLVDAETAWSGRAPEPSRGQPGHGEHRYGDPRHGESRYGKPRGRKSFFEELFD